MLPTGPKLALDRVLQMGQISSEKSVVVPSFLLAPIALSTRCVGQGQKAEG